MDKGRLTHYTKDLGPGKDVGLESRATVEFLSFFPYKSQEVHGLPKPQIVRWGVCGVIYLHLL